MTLTIDTQRQIKKPDPPKLMNQIKNSTILKIKLKINTHTQRDSIRLLYAKEQYAKLLG